MNLEQTSRWRDLSGWAAAGFCLLALLALLDGLIGQFREPANLIKLLPGMTAEIDGPLQEEVQGIQELTYLSDSKDLKLTFALSRVATNAGKQAFTVRRSFGSNVFFGDEKRCIDIAIQGGN